MMLICARCRNDASRLDGLRAYAFHGGSLRRAINQFKYEGLRSLAVVLGELMSLGWGVLFSEDRVTDVIVPVPLHPRRQRKRGYNQSALLARELGVRVGCPVVEDVLVRTRPTPPQVGLDADERRANVEGAFECVGDGLAGSGVLLVDDVYTTGATLEAACAALRDTGVSSVWAYTLARAGQGALGL
jgi:ComF family protein